MNRSVCPPPPVLALWLVHSVLPGDGDAAMVGDLIEEYYARSEFVSSAAASWWFWSQVFRSIPSMVKSSLLKPDRVGNAGVAIGVFFVLATLKVVVERLLSAYAVLGNLAHIVLAPIFFLAATSIAGCVATRIRRGATLFLALDVWVAVMVLMAGRVCAIPVPWWYQFIFLTLGPLSVLLVPAALRPPHSQQ